MERFVTLRLQLWLLLEQATLIIARKLSGVGDLLMYRALSAIYYGSKPGMAYFISEDDARIDAYVTVRDPKWGLRRHPIAVQNVYPGKHWPAKYARAVMSTCVEQGWAVVFIERNGQMFGAGSSDWQPIDHRLSHLRYANVDLV